MVNIVLLLLNFLYLQSEYIDICIQYSCVNSVLFKTDYVLFKGVASFFKQKLLIIELEGLLLSIQKNKRIDEPIINSYMYNEIITTAIYSGTLCILFLKLPIIREIFRIGENNKYLMTAYFALFIFIGIFNSFNARTYRINIFSNILKNRIYLLVITFIITVQIYLIYFGGDLFRTYGLTAKEFLIILLIALSVWPVDALRKMILKKKNLKRMV